MKVGDVVKCRYTQKIGLVVRVPDEEKDEWCYSILFSEGIEEQNGGYLEVLNEGG